jgi:UDP-glucose 4-epimerase
MYGLDYVVLRYPNVYGPRQDPHGEAGVVAIFTGQMLAGQPVIINGDGEQERDFVFVGDCARANLLALENPAASGIYNLGCGRGTTVNQIFRHPSPPATSGGGYGPAEAGDAQIANADRTVASWRGAGQPGRDQGRMTTGKAGRAA